MSSGDQAEGRVGKWAEDTVTRRRALVLGAQGAAGLSLAGFLAACGSGGTPTGGGGGGSKGAATLAYATIGEKILNPVNLDANPAGDIASVRYGALVTRDPKTLDPVPQLAKGWQVLDDKAYKFELRPGFTFPEGQPLTSKDCKATLEAFISPQAGETATGFAYEPWLEGVEIIDDLNFIVHAKIPYRIALRSMGVNSFIIPASSAKPLQLDKAPPGNGPYMLRQAVPNDRAVTDVNTGAKGVVTPKLEGITFRSIPEDSSRVAALQTGEVDWIGNCPPDAIPGLEGEDIEVNSIPSIRVMIMQFNFEKPGPWHDKRVRQAMNYAVDKDAINEALFGGLAEVSVAPESPLLEFTPTNLAPYTYDPEKARQLLTEAGYPNGFDGGTFVTTAGQDLGDKQLAEALQAAFEEVGIRYQLRALQLDSFFAQAPDHELGMSSWAATEGDPAAGLYAQTQYQFPYTLGGYEKQNPGFAKELEKAAQIFDPKEARPVYEKLETEVWDEALRVFLYELPMIWANRKGLTGFEPAACDNFFWSKVQLA